MEQPKILGNVEASARRSRNERLTRLLSTLPKPISVLDVGGTTDYWATVGLPPEVFRRIVLLNTFEQATKGPFVSVIADARDLSQYSEAQFDLVFSNSVIGHVGGFDDQLRMAREVMRVGKHFFLQTPNHGFPIDWRTLVPFFHFLPVNAQAWCFERFPVGKYRRSRDRSEAFHLAARVRNIRRRDIHTLFPNANVEVERVLGFPKSFMIHNLPEARESRIRSAALLAPSVLSLESASYELAPQLMALV